MRHTTPAPALNAETIFQAQHDILCILVAECQESPELPKENVFCLLMSSVHFYVLTIKMNGRL